ncbi:hypothetical protein [Coralliovum pocilloporae]|uniref:hypothetical protein n=1 Tax=Coralliovum pocilloporae TaxID=3066369 RepID=UPI0033075796
MTEEKKTLDIVGAGYPSLNLFSFFQLIIFLSPVVISFFIFIIYFENHDIGQIVKLPDYLSISKNIDIPENILVEDNFSAIYDIFIALCIFSNLFGILFSFIYPVDKSIYEYKYHHEGVNHYLFLMIVICIFVLYLFFIQPDFDSISTKFIKSYFYLGFALWIKDYILFLFAFVGCTAAARMIISNIFFSIKKG